MLNIALWEGIPLGAETVPVQVYAIVGSNEPALIYNQSVNVNTFPIAIPISGSGAVEYIIYTLDANNAQIQIGRYTHTFE
jgi:hypothetical protein